MDTPVKHYLVTSGELQKAILEKVNAYIEFKTAAELFRHRHGATHVCSTGHENVGVVGLVFAGGIAPDGWTKPRRPGCISRAKRGTDAHTELAALPSYPTNTEVLKNVCGLPVTVEHEGDELGGHMLFKELNPVKLEGYPKYRTFLVTVPDVQQIINALPATDKAIVCGADKWEMTTPGAVEITMAEWEHMKSHFEALELKDELPHIPCINFAH